MRFGNCCVPADFGSVAELKTQGIKGLRSHQPNTTLAAIPERISTRQHVLATLIADELSF
jgi:hypothetical protein